jgi:dienelactone hydrolase
MKKKILLLGILSCLNIFCYSQKPLIDSSVFGKWPKVSFDGIISSDGKFVSYSVNQGLNRKQSLFLQGIDNAWKKEISNGDNIFFSKDGENAIFIKDDSLNILRLGTEDRIIEPHVNEYKVYEDKTKSILIYYIRDEKELVIHDIHTRDAKKFLEVNNYINIQSKPYLLIQLESSNKEKSWDFKLINLQTNKETIVSRQSSFPVSNSMFCPSGDSFIYVDTKTQGDDTLSKLHWYDINDGQDRTISCHKSNPIHFVFDKEGKQLIYMIGNEVWYYRQGSEKASMRLNITSVELEPELKITNNFKFSGNGKWICFTLIKHPGNKKDIIERAAGVDVWNYKETPLQSQQLKEIIENSVMEYHAVIPVQKKGSLSGEIIRLDHEGDALLTSSEEIYGEYVLVIHRRGSGISSDVLRKGDTHDWWWNAATMPAVCLVSLIDGKRTVLRGYSPSYFLSLPYFISTNGRYVLYFENSGGKNSRSHWYSYEIATGIKRCLTKNIGVSFALEQSDDNFPRSRYAPYRGDAIEWIDGGNKVLLHDRYDIWELSVANESPAVCLTEHYGRKNKIIFNILNRKENLKIGDTIQFTGFNRISKDAGYFEKIIGQHGIHKIIFGPYLYTYFKKADNALCWLVMRQSAEMSPNYFITKDGKKFVQISHVAPESNYNWMTAELIHWKTFNGNYAVGMLYKPNNFNPKKKYPVILHYYERLSDGFHYFLYPDYSYADLNIPYYVSQGYLIFVPDIYYNVGEVGESAYNYIVSGATNLMKRPYVDGRRLALQGHSFGGYQTQFIVTHSKLFAAVVAAAGWPDLISRYGAIMDNSYGESGQFTSEIERSRIGATLWQRPDLYIKNSPIFNADKVTTPLLLMNNKEDAQVPFSGAMELFTALRRLGKKVWLLQYDGEDHLVTKEKNVFDYTVRMKQFFDHYLKDAPAPRWMVEGVPARLKGIETGYELEPGKTP